MAAADMTVDMAGDMTAAAAA
jgi:hypothetical protein